ncbi:hypothetical protein [Oceanobacillus neutriphilus]|uniref:DUF2157 domain-containing protein n=1 Tax=Oceanobacillus neutriphilus TaxID=531815 RepID=A0ABQ2NMM7_9BACI|nr:hypothetical protein [Oceanobacillus neutriphilus]GGP07240.1 hypothetical protein GCM10011346_02430 [Oceanobacillus neutriphilus]
MSIISNSKTRAQILQEELIELLKRDLISMEDYKKILTAHQEYAKQIDKSMDTMQRNESQMEDEKEIPSEEMRPAAEQNQPEGIEKTVPKPDNTSGKSILTSFLQGNMDKKEWLSAPEQQEKSVQKKDKPVREPKTAEQIRERNITWLLILGVSFLLISGLVVATSTWDQMGALLKVITLLGVSVFFLALSGLSSRFLKIEKTAFAFLTLGSLLLPIAIIGIGYFGLFGDYLTLTGEGRYWLGILCTLVPLPLYAWNAYKTEAKLFVWISYLFLSFFIGFLLAALQVPVDMFFFLMMLYNAVLLFAYHHFQKEKKQILRVFLDELPAYAQLNLIVSTLLMLFVYNQAVFYSFNVLLTAFIYMAMVFVYQTKGYQFVFAALFAYGIYQLTENSILNTADSFIYALMGAAYLGFAYIMRKDNFASKAFYYLSGIISAFAFLYVTFQGLIIRADGDSWFILLAYAVIAGTYIYLAEVTKRGVFRWLAPVFLISAGTQFWSLVIQPLFPESILNFMFFYMIALFLFIGFKNRIPYMQAVQKSMFFWSMPVIAIIVLLKLLFLEFIEAAGMFTIIGAVAFYVTSASEKPQEKHIAAWAVPINWLLAMYILYFEFAEKSYAYRTQLDLPFQLAAAGIVLLGISLIWKQRKQKELTRTTFYTGQGSYLLAMLLLYPDFTGDEMIVRPLILLIGIGVMYWLVRFTKQHIFWSLVAAASLGFYVSLLSTFSIHTLDGFVWFMLGLPILFLAVERYLGKLDASLKPYFFYFAHAVLLFLVFTIAGDGVAQFILYPAVWFVPLSMYVYTALTKQKEWEIKAALYAGSMMLIGAVVSFISYYDWMADFSFVYTWLVAGIVLIAVWSAVPEVWKRRIDWFLIPYLNLVLAMGVFLAAAEELWQLISLAGLVILNLYFLHRRKWTLFLAVPLFFSVYLWQLQGVFKGEIDLWLIFCLGFGILAAAGRYLFTSLYISYKGSVQTVDWYSLMALAYLAFALSRVSELDNIWLTVIPYVLFASWFFLQVDRLGSQMLQKIFITVGGVACLPPYYLVLDHYIYIIPEVIYAELQALPVLALAIILSKKTWHNYESLMRHIQTVLLIIVTVYLIADAIQSATILDALIIGILSIVSLLAGMRYQLKSYFFVGIGTLLFNVIYQTRPYWGNLPWWAYLLIAGILFISIASYNEWKKQREGEGKLEKKLNQILARFKEWN